jgi:hypothetical protein
MNKTRYELQALGRGLLVSTHRLSLQEFGAVKGYCKENEEDLEYISTSLDGVLEDYDPFETNEWQTGILPLLSGLSLDLLDFGGKQLFSISSPLEGGIEAIDEYDLQYEVEPKDGNLLLFCEDYKGHVASWFLESDSIPTLGDFSFKVGRIDINEEQTEYIEKLFYKGVELERNYDNISMEGKGAYHALF